MPLHSVLAVVLALFSIMPALSQKTTTSAQTCVDCHRAQAEPQPGTQMARAMQLSPHNSVLNGNPRLTFSKNGYTYSVDTKNGIGTYTVTDGRESITVPIVWALGAQAQTWVLVRNGQLYESLVSYYPSIPGLDITTGDEIIKPASVEEALGRPIGTEEAKACFGCHATHAVMARKLNFETIQPGVTCEHCHLEASAHLTAINANSENVPIPKKLGSMSSEDMSNFCGQCHRTWETVVRSGWRGTADVRFQPYRLANSRCFNGADPRISCVACHNPHEKVVRDENYYDAKCLSCHATDAYADGTLVRASAGKGAVSPGPQLYKTCPVSKSNCVSCHMPRVSLPNGHITFTDHEIRVVHPGDAYPN